MSNLRWGMPSSSLSLCIYLRAWDAVGASERFVEWMYEWGWMNVEVLKEEVAKKKKRERKEFRKRERHLYRLGSTGGWVLKDEWQVKRCWESWMGKVQGQRRLHRDSAATMGKMALSRVLWQPVYHMHIFFHLVLKAHTSLNPINRSPFGTYVNLCI